ncbi:hypothetical protein KO504_01285 [Winogradskyella psychrotolerans]|uniref:hypothetical protein n=1 Tax=Winogradskyella psychrotolerans TaxID=1344585 RepID=UPI001C07BC51|nr:hypothetical protein [Winogradskyella psychrotolerans]MBU2919962.1 hypothetical protein [Winogradskyella psychrotolerans]
MPYRQLGYVIFLKSFSFLFGLHFDVVVVTIHAIFSLFGVHFFYKKATSLFNLNNLYKFFIIAILLFPFFPPLLIANNLCSEGLGYGLYLIFIAIGVDILFNNKQEYIKYYIIVFLGLVFMRSQFIISTLIFAGVYFLIHRKYIFKRKHLLTILVMCGVVLIASLTERSYHKLKDGFFKPTPLGYTSASTAPIYLSDSTDYLLIEDKDYREILKISFDTLIKKDLLLKANETPKQDYLFFHNNLPKICNQTVRKQGVEYYLKKEQPKEWSFNQAASYPYFETEAACKVYTFTLIRTNFGKWLQLFYTNITHGFYTPLLFFFVVIMFFFSLIKTTFYYKRSYAILFLLSSLILSNALFIAFASHSIQRYLFYNYALLFLLFISTIKLLKREQ